MIDFFVLIPHMIKNTKKKRILLLSKLITEEIVHSTIDQPNLRIKELRQQKYQIYVVIIAHEDFGNLHAAQGLSQMHFDQLKAVVHRLNSIKYGDSYDLYYEPQDEGAIIHRAIVGGAIPHKPTCYKDQNMFSSNPSIRPASKPKLRKNKEEKI